MVVGAPRSRARSTCASRSAATGRSSPRCAHFAGTGVPVFGVNFGEVGFLATIDPDGLGDDFDRAFAGSSTPSGCRRSRRPPGGTWRPQRHLGAPQGGPARRRPGLRARGGGDRPRALRRARGLHAAGLDGLQPRQRRPRIGLGRGGYVVSFIAPHSLTARALVVAPGDELTINNASPRGAGRGAVDGRPTCELPPGEDLHVEFGQPTARSPSCRARPSTTACASASAGWRSDARAPNPRRTAPPHRSGRRSVPCRRALGRPSACSSSCASRTSC